MEPEAAADESESEQDVVLKVAMLQDSSLFASKVGNQREADRLFNEELLPLYKQNNMVAFYKEFCILSQRDLDISLVSLMEANVRRMLEESEAKQATTEKTEGDVEVLDAILARCEILRLTHSLQDAMALYNDNKLKALTTGKKIDKNLSVLRLCLAWKDDILFKQVADDTKILIEKGGDWERRNRFNVYTGMYNLRVRNFDISAKSFLDAISTFTANEMFGYNDLVYYTIISSIVSLDRTEIKLKLIDSPEILQIIDSLPVLKSFLNSFYECRYNEFFRSLIELMNEFIRKDFYLSLHASYYLKRIRLRAYAQFLQSYQSVKLQTMAQAFGVSTQFMDAELSSYIASNELVCKIDKVNGVVEIHRTIERNAQYGDIVKKGDALLTRIQRLSRVVTY